MVHIIVRKHVGHHRVSGLVSSFWFNSSPGQNGRYFTDDFFGCILVNENVCIFIKISLKFVPGDPTDNDPVLFR